MSVEEKRRSLGEKERKGLWCFLYKKKKKKKKKKACLLWNEGF
jgi:hypothetical protein